MVRLSISSRLHWNGLGKLAVVAVLSLTGCGSGKTQRDSGVSTDTASADRAAENRDAQTEADTSANDAPGRPDTSADRGATYDQAAGTVDAQVMESRGADALSVDSPPEAGVDATPADAFRSADRVAVSCSGLNATDCAAAGCVFISAGCHDDPLESASGCFSAGSSPARPPCAPKPCREYTETECRDQSACTWYTYPCAEGGTKTECVNAAFKPSRC
jgi:hypothetical protein